MDIEFEIKTFEELSTLEIYKILRLRAEVFVVEQDCVYQDVDNKDQKAIHIIGYKNDQKEKQIIAYTRIFGPGDYFECSSIGRVVIQESERTYGYGHLLIKTSIEAVEKYFDKGKIKISAQTHLKNFYERHHFKQIGEGYLEDGIPHIAMIRD